MTKIPFQHDSMSKRDFCFAYFNLEKYVIADHNAAASTADRSKTQGSACVVRSCKAACAACIQDAFGPLAATDATDPLAAGVNCPL